MKLILRLIGLKMSILRVDAAIINPKTVKPNGWAKFLVLGSTTVFTDLRQNVLAGYFRFMVVSTLLTSAVVLISMEIEHSKVLEAMRRSCNIIEWYFAQPFFDSKKEMILRQYQQFAALRIRLFEKKEILLWLRLIQYYDFYRSIRQEIGDLYLLIKDL